MNRVAEFRKEFQAGMQVAETSGMTGTTALGHARPCAMSDEHIRRTYGARDEAQLARAREQLLQVGSQKFGRYPQIMDASTINRLPSLTLLEAVTVGILNVRSWAELIGDDAEPPTSPGQRPREQMFW